MPITRKQFELGIDSEIEEWMKKIHSFLSEHKDQAFSEGELRESLGLKLPTPVKEIKAFEAALDKIVGLGVAEERLILDKSYYSQGRKPLPV